MISRSVWPRVFFSLCSTRWILPAISTTTEQPWEEPRRDQSRLTAAERRWWWWRWSTRKDFFTHVFFIEVKPRKTPILYQVKSTSEFNLAKVNISLAPVWPVGRVYINAISMNICTPDIWFMFLTHVWNQNPETSLTHVDVEAARPGGLRKTPRPYLLLHVKLKGEEVGAEKQTEGLSLPVPCYRLGVAFPSRLQHQRQTWTRDRGCITGAQRGRWGRVKVGHEEALASVSRHVVFSCRKG